MSKSEKILGIIGVSFAGAAFLIFLLAVINGLAGWGMFTGVIILAAVPFLFAGLVLSIIAFAKSRNALSIAAFAVSMVNVSFLAFIIIGNVL